MQFDRAQLTAALNGNRVLVAQFEDLAEQSDNTAETIGDVVQATDAASNASYVTLSPNASLSNEFLLTAGNGITIKIADGKATISVRVRAQGGNVLFQVPVPNATLLLPSNGVLVSEEGTATLSNKTLDTLRVAEPAVAATPVADRKLPIMVDGVMMYLLLSST